jgi:monoterpene epsilon-lactone hydrolase
VRPALRLPPAAARQVLRLVGGVAFDPDAPWARQRRVIDGVGATTLARRGTRIVHRSVGGVPCEEVTAPGAGPSRHVLHLHGGGYTLGHPPLLRAWASAVSAATGAVVVLPDYRLAPEHPAPAALRDVRAAWDGLAAAQDPATIVISGDSAGGGLALGLGQALAAESRPPAGLVLVCPWLDLTADRRAPAALARRDVLLDPGWLARCAEVYAADRNPSDPQLSPLLGELGGLPPVLVQAAGDDLLVPDADRFVTGARAAGTEVTYTRAAGLWHDFPLQAGLVTAADRAVQAAASFMTRCWDAHREDPT